ncbi:MAG: MBL fold metallo-hydrolase [Patescibacteria group bacterium]
MIITHNTLESFKVQFGDTMLAFNPVSKKSKLSATSFGADIVLVTLNHPDMNGIETVARGDKVPFTIVGPGEYEVKEIFVKGFPSVSSYGGEQAINTVYTVILEDMRLCFLGALATTDLPPETLEAMGDIDILFAPVGGDGVLSPKDAHKLSVSLEPHCVIPMHYTKETLAAFLKEEGVSVEPLDKLTIKKKDVLEKEGEIFVLKPTTNN